MKVKVGQQVSVPDRVIFPNRRDPYEWENGIVIEIREGKARVRVLRSFTNAVREAWFSVEWLKRPTFHQRLGQREEFEKWVKQQ